MTLNPEADKRIPSLERNKKEIQISFSDFTTTTEIDSGGMATVYEATVENYSVGRIAIKEPHWDDTVERSEIEEFISKVGLWEKVDDHPHICSVFGSGSASRPWIAMEYLDDGTLEEQIPVNDIREALWITSAVADAIQYAHHRGIAHHDLKPSNVLLQSTPNKKWNFPKIADWGLATALNSDKRPSSFSMPYAAPEQLSAEVNRRVGPRTDIYQLGALLYALLTGRSPREEVDGGSQFSPISLSKIQGTLPSEVNQVAIQALAHNPEERVTTAAQFGEACADCFRDLTGRSETTAAHAGKKSKPQKSAEQPKTEKSDKMHKNSSANSDTPSQWFTPTEYPEAQTHSLAEDLRMETKNNKETEGSLANDIRDISEPTIAEKIETQLSLINNTNDKN